MTGKPFSARKLAKSFAVGNRALFGQDDEAIGRSVAKAEKARSMSSRAELNGFGVETQLFRELDKARRLGGLLTFSGL